MSTHARDAAPMRVLYCLMCGLMLASSGCARAQTVQTAAKKKVVMSKTATPRPSAAAVAWLKLKSLYDYDRKTPLGAQTIDLQSDAIGSTRRMTIRGERGETIPLIVVMPRGASAQKKVPGVVLLHGKDDDLNEVLMLFMARSLAANGYASLIPEVAKNDAQGKPKADPLSADAALLRRSFIASIHDVRRTLDLFTAQPEIDATRIGLIGLSLGSIRGAVTTSVDTRIKTAVFLVGGADWPTILSQSEDPDTRAYHARYVRKSASERQRQDQILADVDPRNFVAHIASRPILMINGTKDVLIPKASAQALFSAAREPKKQIWLPYGHFLSTEVRPLIQSWIDEHLKPARAPMQAEKKTSGSISASQTQAAPAPQSVSTSPQQAPLSAVAGTTSKMRVESAARLQSAT